MCFMDLKVYDCAPQHVLCGVRVVFIFSATSEVHSQGELGWVLLSYQFCDLYGQNLYSRCNHVVERHQFGDLMITSLLM